MAAAGFLHPDGNALRRLIECRHLEPNRWRKNAQWLQQGQVPVNNVVDLGSRLD
jgi:hypothetical protein